MIGRRIWPTEDGWLPNLEPGDYGRISEARCAEHAGRSAWHGCTPNGHQCNLGGHKIVEHEDGAITVSPSILVSGSRWDEVQKTMVRAEWWHGFLEHGVWQSC
jgi:hypothetical protein